VRTFRSAWIVRIRPLVGGEYVSRALESRLDASRQPAVGSR